MEWVARRGRRAAGKEQARRIPARGCNEQATQPTALLPRALQGCKRLMKSSTRDQLDRAVELENEEFSVRVRSAEAKEAFNAFLEKRRPNFAKTNETANPKAQAPNIF